MDTYKINPKIRKISSKMSPTFVKIELFWYPPQGDLVSLQNQDHSFFHMSTYFPK